MKVTQTAVKAWLKEHHRSRKWLADQCDAALQTVNNWLGSDRGIPSKAVLIIEKLMAFDEAQAKSAEPKPPNHLVLEFAEKEFDDLCHASAKERMVPRVWAQTKLNELAKADVYQIAEEIRALKVAEDEKPYGSNIIDPTEEAENAANGTAGE